MNIQAHTANVIEMAIERGIKQALSTDNSELTEEETVAHFLGSAMESLSLVVSFEDLEVEYED